MLEKGNKGQGKRILRITKELQKICKLFLYIKSLLVFDNLILYFGLYPYENQVLNLNVKKN